MIKNTYDSAPPLRFNGEAPQERLPSEFLGDEYLDAMLAPYPAKVPYRFAEREYNLRAFKAWLDDVDLGLGGAVLLETSANYRCEVLEGEQFIGPVKIFFIDQLGQEVRKIKTHFDQSIALPDELINLDRPPALEFAIGKQAVLRAAEPPKWASNLMPWKSIRKNSLFERRRSDAVTALGELKRACDTSPSVLIGDTCGAVLAPKESRETAGTGRIHEEYLHKIGYRWDPSSGRDVGHVPEVVLSILKNEVDPATVREYRQLLVSLQHRTDNMASREPYWAYESQQPGKKKTKKWIDEERLDYVNKITDLVDQLLQVGFSSYMAGYRTVINLGVPRPDWLYLLESDNIPMTPNDLEDEQTRRIWRIRHELVGYLLGSQYHFTDEQLCKHALRARFCIDHQSRIVQQHPDYEVDSESITRDLQKDALVDALKNSLSKLDSDCAAAE